jgi:hypothetical protein
MDPHVPGRRAHRRFSVQLEVTITLRNPFARSTGPLNEGLTLVGRTKNICETGLAVVVSAGNIDRYLKRKDLPIEIELRLPSGPVKVQVTPIHYKRFSSSEGSVTYLIGSSFSQTEPADLEVLLKFLRSLPTA